VLQALTAIPDSVSHKGMFQNTEFFSYQMLT